MGLIVTMGTSSVITMETGSVVTMDIGSVVTMETGLVITMGTSSGSAITHWSGEPESQVCGQDPEQAQHQWRADKVHIIEAFNDNQFGRLRTVNVYQWSQPKQPAETYVYADGDGGGGGGQNVFNKNL